MTEQETKDAAEPPLDCQVMRAELSALKALMAELLEQLGERDEGDGNAPGHSHDIPGVWDSDNGKLAGKPCAWCAVWNKAKATGLVHNLNSTT